MSVTTVGGACFWSQERNSTESHGCDAPWHDPVQGPEYTEGADRRFPSESDESKPGPGIQEPLSHWVSRRPIPIGKSHGPITSFPEGCRSASGYSIEPHLTVASLYSQSSLAMVPIWDLAFLPFVHYQGESPKNKHQRPKGQRSACLVHLKKSL